MTDDYADTWQGEGPPPPEPDDFAVVREWLPEGMRPVLDRIEARLNVLAGYTERIEARCQAAEAERDKLRADAERLAEALRRIARAPTKSATWVGDVARAALAAHEEER